MSDKIIIDPSEGAIKRAADIVDELWAVLREHRCALHHHADAIVVDLVDGPKGLPRAAMMELPIRATLIEVQGGVSLLPDSSRKAIEGLSEALQRNQCVLVHTPGFVLLGAVTGEKRLHALGFIMSITPFQIEWQEANWTQPGVPS